MGFFGKILTIAAVIVIAWYGWRWWQQQIAARAAAKPPQSPPPAEPAARTGRPQVEDLVACRVCGAYVPAGTVHCDKRVA